MQPEMKPQILYIFGGEKAQGAEIVIERLMYFNQYNVHNHLFIAPGEFASRLIEQNRPYTITCLSSLKKLNRSKASLVNYICTAIKNYFSISYRTLQYVKANNINFVHANTVVPASYLIPVIIYAKMSRKNIRWFWSDHDITYYSKLENHLSNICSKLYDRTLAVSNAVKAKYKYDKKVKVLYNGLDYNFFKPSSVFRKIFRHSYNFTNGTIVFGLPAVITPRKGQLELIKVFINLSRDHDNIILLLAGSFEASTPEYTDQVKALLNNNEKIKHIGFVENMCSFYNGCDVVINNSSGSGSEPLGTTIYEAMACEKIMVASMTGGTSEIITDHLDGILFEVANNDDLAQKLSYVISEINNLYTLQKAARQKVIAKFNIQLMVDRYNRILLD